MNLLYVVILGALMQAARSYAPSATLGAMPGGTILGAGYLLLSAYLVGSAFKLLGLPKLTGYLVTGILTGPEVLDLVSRRMLEDLTIFNGLATALIALTAGTELDWRALRPLMPSIRWIGLLGLGGTILILAAAILLFPALLPFTAGLTNIELLALSLPLALTLAAQSPAVVVALRKEVGADGPLTRTVLGVVVVAELTIVGGYTLSSSIAQTVFGGGKGWLEILGHLGIEIPGSLIVGVLAGMVIAAFLKLVRNEGALFILAAGFLIAEVGRRLGFDILLVALAAGLYIRNFTTLGHRLHDDVEAGSLPVFVTFFSVAGATLHLHALRSLIGPVVLFAAIRAAGYLVGGRIGARIADAPDSVRRFVGFGMLPQAGLALSIALVFLQQFPRFGEQAAALIFGVVSLNELVCPVLYRLALLRSGEAGRKPDDETEPSEAPETGAAGTLSPAASP